MTPGWVGGIFYIIPSLSILAILAGLYGLYLFYLGLPLLMETPKEKSLGYVIVVIIVTILYPSLSEPSVEQFFQFKKDNFTDSSEIII